MPFSRFHSRLQEKAADPGARAVTYVAFGDSVTQGCMELGVIEYERVYHQIFKRCVEGGFPGTVINVINSGFAGDTANASRSRWQRDVLMYEPDLVTIGFGLNDAHGGPDGVEPYIKAIGDLVDRLRNETGADILLVVPGMMMKRDNDRIHESHRSLVTEFIRVADAGYLAMYVEALRCYAREADVPYFDSYRMWEQMEQDGIDIHTRLSNGINHPDADFHVELGKALANTIFR
ncbi:SGNH/GDSL hydrolase family protein [Cohnella soli]|uniref:SGNH/GDSL hydrolase family protein n=1 Tax=Cohnella soli TaxID=425005 RepID=A0ABW0I1M9_9BACL